MEHDARAEVGLQRHWYVATCMLAACNTHAAQLLTHAFNGMLHGMMLSLLLCRYDRSLWPAMQQVDVPATDLAALRLRLAALLTECGDLTSCQSVTPAVL